MNPHVITPITPDVNVTHGGNTTKPIPGGSGGSVDPFNSEDPINSTHGDGPIKPPTDPIDNEQSNEVAPKGLSGGVMAAIGILLAALLLIISITAWKKCRSRPSKMEAAKAKHGPKGFKKKGLLKDGLLEAEIGVSSSDEESGLPRFGASKSSPLIKKQAERRENNKKPLNSFQ